MAIAKQEILDAIGSMSVLELSQLIKDMEEKFGVKISFPMIADLDKAESKIKFTLKEKEKEASEV